MDRILRTNMIKIFRLQQIEKKVQNKTLQMIFIEIQ